MKAVCWNGANDVRVETVPDPKITNPRDRNRDLRFGFTSLRWV